MKLILEFDEFDSLRKRESKTRTKSLSDDEFLNILKSKCTNFSFNNDQLWRKSGNNIGKLGLFFEGERKQTIGEYSYKDFFEERKGYIVPRYKSLIGSTTLQGADLLGSGDSNYLVIPFDNANIIFAGSSDLALWSNVKQEFKDDLFLLGEYKSGFKVPTDDLWKILNSSKLSSAADTLRKKNLGFEFFTNSNCLLVSESKVDWLKSLLK